MGIVKLTLLMPVVDLPIPEMTWRALPAFMGTTYADMIVEILNQKGIPHYVKNNWSNSAYGVSGSELVDNVIRIFVPKTRATSKRYSQYNYWR